MVLRQGNCSKHLEPNNSGVLVHGTFTENPIENVVHIPNLDLELCQGVGRQKKKKIIRNNMNEVEAGPASVIVLMVNFRQPISHEFTFSIDLLF
jgi:hypothetical protein